MILGIIVSSCNMDKVNYITQQMDLVKNNSKDLNALKRIEDEMSSLYYRNRVHAAAALGRIGMLHKELGSHMQNVLISGLSDHDQAVRRESASALCGIAQLDTVSAIPYLEKCLKEGDNDVAWFSAMALGNYGSLASEAVPGLVKTLDAYSGSAGFNLISEKCADALGKIGDSRAKEALLRASKSTNERTALAANVALKAIQ